MERPVTNESLCFVCQENEPTHKATRGAEVFKVCKTCAALITLENNQRNRIKSGLYNSDKHKLFQYTLGADLSPIQIKIEELNDEE